MKGILQSRSSRPFVPPDGLLAQLGLEIQGEQNWLAATSAVDGLQLALWRGDDPLVSRHRNESACYENTFGEAIEVSFIRDALLAEVPKDAAVYSEVCSQLTDQLIAAELRLCGGRKSGALASLKSDVAHMVEAAQEKHACTKEASSAKKPVKFIAKAAPGMLGLTTVHHDYIQGRLNRLRALQAQDEWLAAMAEGGMRYTDDGLQIDLDGPNLPNGSKPFATVPLASIRFYDVIKKDGAQIYEIIIKTPVFAGGVWSMSETREEFSAISKWVQNNLGTSADAIAQKLMSQDQTKVLDFLAQARQQVQREIAETVQAMPKLACGDACVSTLGALSSRAFPKLPSSPSLMV